MRTWLVAGLLAMLSIGATQSVAQGGPSARQAATAALASRIAALATAAQADVGLAYRRLDGTDELFARADEPFHAASTMKVPVLIELFRQVDAGTLRLDDEIPVVNRFSSIVDGSPYSLDVADDSDNGDIYRQIGQTMTLRALAEAMVTVSSNLATNLLMEKVGVQNVQRTVAALGADDMKVLRGVEDNKAFQQGLNNTTTARGLLVLFDAIAHDRAAAPASCHEMLAILKRQRFNEGIPAGLPPGIAVAHKTGSITKIHHDAGIVYTTQPYILVVLVRGIEDQARSAKLIADISRLVYEHVSGDAPAAGAKPKSDK